MTPALFLVILCLLIAVAVIIAATAGSLTEQTSAVLG